MLMDDVVTLASDQSLAELNGEEVMMTEGDGALASYTLTTSEITSVSGAAPAITLAFTTPNPDLKYFRPGDVVQGVSYPSGIYAVTAMDNSIDGIEEYKSYGGGAGLLSNTQVAENTEFIKFNPLLVNLDTSTDVKVQVSTALSGGTGWTIIADEVWTDFGKQSTTKISDYQNSKIVEFIFPANATYFSFAPSNYTSMSTNFIGSIIWDKDNVTSQGTVNVPNEILYGEAYESDSVKVISTDVAANTMVVDGGAWSDGSGVPANENRDKIWSEKTTKLLVGDIAGSFDFTKMFDGSTSTYCGVLGSNGATNITYSFNGGLATANSTIRIFCHCGDGVNPVTFKFNNNLN